MPAVGGAVDPRIDRYKQATKQMQKGQYKLSIYDGSNDQIGELGQELDVLAHQLDQQYEELQRLDNITLQINNGLLLEDIMDNIYETFRAFIPYNRIGLSLVNEDRTEVQAFWARSESSNVQIERGYSAPLAGSSLGMLLNSEKPRIINDLVAYLRSKPESASTRRIVAEGIRSSLTCPLVIDGRGVGFLFFSSMEADTYKDTHVDIFQHIAKQVAIIVEKGKLVSQITFKQQAIEAQNQELLRLNNLKNMFVGMAAHDLRNPLATIRSGIDFVLAPDVELSQENQDIILRDIEQQTLFMLSLIDDLLDYSAMEAGKVDLRLESINLQAFLMEATDRHNRLAKSKGTTVALITHTPATIVGDPNRLRQVVDNLISNAVKYSPLGSKVTLSVETLDDYWRINIKDQGPGIPENERDNLFEGFTRLSIQPTGGERSTGLGLAITRQIVEAHGGQIGVETEIGRGSTFWFTLLS